VPAAGFSISLNHGRQWSVACRPVTATRWSRRTLIGLMVSYARRSLLSRTVSYMILRKKDCIRLLTQSGDAYALGGKQAIKYYSRAFLVEC
jgi:hypothetical protein